MKSYGYEPETTPNLDKIAKEGYRFVHAYSSAPETITSLTTMMNDQLFANNLMTKYLQKRFFRHSPTIPEILKSKGYLTSMFSDHPFFKESGCLYAEQFNERDVFGKEFNGVTAHLLANKIIRWLERNHQKFFLSAHFYDPHYNYNPLPAYEGHFGYSRESCGSIFNGIDMVKMINENTKLEKQEIDCLISLHDAEVFFTDKQVGRIFRKIQELGIENKTMIIIAAANRRQRTISEGRGACCQPAA